jgi:hypothetical protein
MNFFVVKKYIKLFLIKKKLELIEHIFCVPWCIASATDGFNPREIRSIEHAQDSSMGNRKALFVTLMDHVPRFEAY